MTGGVDGHGPADPGTPYPAIRRQLGRRAVYLHLVAGRRAVALGPRHSPSRSASALRDPEYYQYDLDLPDITEVWRRGSVIASWLLDLSATALINDPALSGFAGLVSDSGEGRWTIK